MMSIYHVIAVVHVLLDLSSAFDIVAHNSIQLQLLLRLFSVKLILKSDEIRPDTYALFRGQKPFLIKETDLSGVEG